MNQEMIKVVKNDQFAKFLGIEITSVDIGQAAVKMQLKKEHLNGMGVAQGGVIFTLADFAFAVAANSAGLGTVGLHADIDYFRPPKGEWLLAKAWEVNRSKTLSNYTVEVTDGEDRLIARFNGTGFTK